jgi:hypothetical protein
LQRRIARLEKRLEPITKPLKVIVYMRRDGESESEYEARRDAHPGGARVEVKIRFDEPLRDEDGYET